jgi:hypothetical protein
MKNAKDLLMLLPTLGIFIFIGLYVYSASLYPGGSQADINSVGFDWANNFWCNLMRENGLNGQKNLAKPVSIFGLIVLTSSMTLFFFQFANHLVKNSTWKMIIKISGTLAMLSANFIFTIYHDVMTTILSVFGALVLIGLIRTIHKRHMTFFKISGIICIILVAINNLMYYNEDLIKFLPIIQKFNFISILAWTVGLNFKIKKEKERNQIA